MAIPNRKSPRVVSLIDDLDALIEQAEAEVEQLRSARAAVKPYPGRPRKARSKGSIRSPQKGSKANV